MKELTVAFCVVGFQAFSSRNALADERATSVSGKIGPHEKITLTYEDYRRIEDASQNEWILALQQFNREIEEIEKSDGLIDPTSTGGEQARLFEIFPFLRPLALDLSKSFALSLGASPAFGAQCRASAQISGNVTKMCLQCPGAEEVCQPVGGIRQIDYESAATSLLKKANVTGSGDASQERAVASLVSVAQQKDTGSSESPSGSVSVNVSPTTGASKSLPAPGSGGPTNLSTSPTGAGTPALNPASPTDAAAPASAVPSPNPVPSSPSPRADDTGIAKRNDHIDVEEYNKKDKLSCIIAGWATENAAAKTGKVSRGKCVGKSEALLQDSSGKKTNYSCKKDADKVQGPRSPEQGQLKTATKPDAQKTILCNPVVFGLDSQGGPLCIRPSATATRACAKASNTDSAKKMLVKNPEEYRRLVRRVDTLCQGKSVKGFTAKGLKDVSATCETLQSQMSKIDPSRDDKSYPDETQRAGRR